MTSIHLSLRSISARWFSALLTIASIALGVFLIIGVEKIRSGAKESFETTIAGTDLIVGARSGPAQLLLYSVFHMGNPSANVSMASYEHFKHAPDVAWTVPLSLGDSHRGFRVVGTTTDYFQHLRYGRDQSLSFQAGGPFAGPTDVVLGAEVARRLGYVLGHKLTLSHGTGDVTFQEHADHPFTVVGILNPTGTPVDRSLSISLDGYEAIHAGWNAPGTPQELTAFLVGLKEKIGIFNVQRDVNRYEAEALSAILPGATFAELWGTLASFDAALAMVGLLIILATTLGMVASILRSLEDRRREMAILRSLGAGPLDIFVLVLSEALFLGLSGAVLGIVLLYASFIALQPLFLAHFGLYIPFHGPGAHEGFLLIGILIAAGVTGCIPAIGAYRRSLADGLVLRI